ncbi:MAG: putative capsid protein [Cressdnaviricota sp.]|nr:MAG: putative capsid protein [Cressdnaviricota sp.]
MARKKYSVMKKRNKIQPSVMTLNLAGPSTPAGIPIRWTVDLSQVASLVNRRFYRQGLNWAVAGFKVTSAGVGIAPNPAGDVVITSLPNTWVTSNAWEKAFRAWNKQQKDDLDEAGGQSAMAKFRDFKVFLDATHVDEYIANGSDLNQTNLLPLAVDSGLNYLIANGGEWEPSQIVVPNTQADASGSLILPREYLLHMVGINNHAGLSRGVLEGYADSRSYPQSPDPVAPDLGSGENWLRDMFNVGDDNSEVIRNATDKNDELPYPQIIYPGGEIQMPGLQLHDFVNLFETNITNGLSIQRLKGGNFPCGLMGITWTPASDAESNSNLLIQIDLVPGNHRGYLCEPMTEM